MLPYRDNKLAFLALGVFFVLIAIYAYFEARNIVFGPQIHLETERVFTVDTRRVVIDGTTENITDISMNGRVIPVTQEGVFEEAVLLSEGYNRITLMARDKLGREQTKILEIIYAPEAGDATLNATTTSNQ